MCGGAELQVHPQVPTKFSKVVVVKLPPIVSNDGIGDPVSAADILLNKIRRLSLRDLAEDSHFYPLGEVVYRHNCMCCRSSALR